MADQVQGAISNIEEIVRSEIRLAQAEMKQKAAEAGRAGASVAAGGVLGLFGLGFLLVAAHKGLSRVMRPGGSAFAIGSALGGASVLLIGSGIGKLKSLNLAPEQAIQTAKETVKTLKS